MCVILYIYIHIFVYTGRLYTSLLPRMVAYDRALENKDIDKVQDHVKNLNLPGFYNCCLYKWKKSRKQQRWTVLCTTAPKLMQTCKEVPNSLRQILGLSLKFQHRNGKDPDNTVSTIMPLALETAVTDIIAS